MLYLPKSGLRSKRGYYGLVTSRGRSGPWMRRLAFPVQTGSPFQVNWRHIFLTAKGNWQAIGPNGSDYVFDNGVAPQDAWSWANEFYTGIYQPGPTVNGVQALGRLVPCVSGEAYFQMVQSLRAAMNLPPLPTPATSTSSIGPDPTPISNTYGTVTVSTDTYQPAQLSPLTALLALEFLDSSQSDASLTVTVSGTPIGVSAVWESTGTPIVTWEQIAHVPGGDNLLVTIPINYALSSVDLSLNFTANGSPQTIPLTFPVLTPTLTLLQVPPFYNLPKNLYASCQYDLDLNAIGFTLTYSVNDPANPVLRSWIFSSGGWLSYPPAPLPNQWMISASAAYTDYYAPPQIADWVVLTYNGQVADNVLGSHVEWPADAVDFLTAWEAVYGTLPEAGNIKVQVQPIHPVSGTAGPALSCTVAWTNGTLRSFDRNTWNGSLFALGGTPSGISVTAPGSGTDTFTVQGMPVDPLGVPPLTQPYAGSISFKAVARKTLPAYSYEPPYPWPAGVTLTFDPPTVTIASGDTSPHTVTITATAVGGAAAFNAEIAIEATDTISTSSFKDGLLVTGDVVYPPLYTGIALEIADSNPYIPTPGSVAIACIVVSYDADTYFGFMQADCTDATCTLTWNTNLSPTDPNYGVSSFSLPPGTWDAPSETVVWLCIAVPASGTTLNTQIYVEADCGTLTALAGLFPDGNTLVGITLTPASASLTIPSPGSATDVITLDNTNLFPVTVNLTGTNLPGELTTTFSSGAVTVPAGTPLTPGSATVTATITVASGISPVAFAVTIEANVGPATAACGITII
jgi:hypothetical protein